MEQGVYELINLWGNSNGKQLPETIIMFRWASGWSDLVLLCTS
jgi:hypothetical protein